MNKILSGIFFSFFLVLTLSHAHAQSVYAQVSSKQVQVGVPFEYAIVINANPNSYSPPVFRDFDIASGPMQSSSTQWINGQTSSQMTISWALVAKREGRLVIGPASVMVGNQRFETSSIAIEALKGPATSQGGQAQAAPASGNLSGNDLFIKTIVNKNRCYLGEQITITQKVYCRLQIIGFQRFAQPTYDGFYSQAQESVSKGQLAVENIDGVNYYSYELFRTVAIANQVGKITLTPVEGDVVIRKQTNAKPRNVFEQFFGAASYEDVPVPIRSRNITVEVLPLPEEGRPADFSGAVGTFTHKVEVSRTELKANDAFNLKYTISGKGNIKLIEPPKLPLPDGFESYEPKVTETPVSKTFDYLIIPRREGEYVLKDLKFSYFNLDTKKYVESSSPEIKIKVLPPDPNSAGAQVYNPHSQVRETENDIRYIKKGDFVLSKTEGEFFNSPAHIALMSFPVAALALGLFIRRKHIRDNSNQALVRERKAAGIARKQLVNAERLMKENKKDEFYSETLTALNNYVGHKLNIPVADLSRDNVSAALSKRKINEVTVRKLIATLDTSEFARFAPGAVSGDLQTVYNNTVQLISDIEQQLNRKQA
jgi:hypothetical protein